MKPAYPSTLSESWKQQLRPLVHCSPEYVPPDGSKDHVVPAPVPTHQFCHSSSETPEDKLYKLTKDLYNLVATAIGKSSLDRIQNKIQYVKLTKETASHNSVQPQIYPHSASSVQKVSVGVNACKRKDSSGQKIIFQGHNSNSINDGIKEKTKSCVKRKRSKKSIASESSRKRSANCKEYGKKKRKIEA
jgi:hypothetical protein